jgi:hypothetical protein
VPRGAAIGVEGALIALSACEINRYITAGVDGARLVTALGRDARGAGFCKKFKPRSIAARFIVRANEGSPYAVSSLDAAGANRSAWLHQDGETSPAW